MKNFKKYILYSILGFLLLSTPSIASTIPENSKNSDEAVVIATVNIQNAKILSQEGNNFNLSFDISNREGVQSGVKYSVKLMKILSSKDYLIADEFVFPDVFSISENTTISKNISYIASPSLSGDYNMIISLKNYSGLPLGSVNLGNVKLTSLSKTAGIIPETCSLSTKEGSQTKNLIEGLIISPSDSLLINCVVVNNKIESVSLLPVFETKLNTIFGEKVEQQGGDYSLISLKSGERKNVSFALPKVITPQSYSVSVYLKDGDSQTNSITAHYTIKGLSATIQNLSLDKDLYQKGDMANISFLYKTSASENDPVVLNINIENKRNRKCIEPISQSVYKGGYMVIPVEIISKCVNPNILVELKHQDGNLDRKEIQFNSSLPSSRDNLSKNLLVTLEILGVIIAISLVVYFINLKKKENENTNI